jgi:hypothetical protein
MLFPPAAAAAAVDFGAAAAAAFNVQHGLSPFGPPLERIPSDQWKPDLTTTISGISYSSMRKGSESLGCELESPFVLTSLGPLNSLEDEATAVEVFDSGVDDDDSDDYSANPGSAGNGATAVTAAATTAAPGKGGSGNKQQATTHVVRIPLTLYLEFAAMVGLFMVTTVVVFQCHRFIKMGMLALVTLVYFAVHLSLAWRAVRRKRGLTSATSAGSNMGLSSQGTLSIAHK